MKKDDKSFEKELKIVNDAMKFCGKAKELNKHYELNNNGEIDNGIIISPQGIYSFKIANTLNNSMNNNSIKSPMMNSKDKLMSPNVELEDAVNLDIGNKVEDLSKNVVKNGIRSSQIH